MAALGYQTGYIGKWHLASNRGRNLPDDRPPARFERKPVPPERRGGYRDVWVAADALEHTSGATSGHVYDETGERFDLHGFRVDALTDIAIDRLDRLDHQRPFLMFVSFLEPHHQNNRFRTIGTKGWAKRFHDFDRPGDLPPWRGDWRWNYAQYLACCASIDANLGRLVDHLNQRGQLDNTLVVFTSDHGSHFRTRNLEYKRSPHDASIRIPLVIAGPGFRDGTHRTDLATNLDLLPTLITATGAEDPDLDGRPLQSDANAPDDLLVQISESQIGRALRTPTHTYAAKAHTRNPFAGHIHPASDRYIGTHLYDNTRDPHQRHNLIDDLTAADHRYALAARLAERIHQVDGTRPTVTSLGTASGLYDSPPLCASTSSSAVHTSLPTPARLSETKTQLRYDGGLGRAAS